MKTMIFSSLLVLASVVSAQADTARTAAKMSDERLDQVVAGTGTPPPCYCECVPEKGNNGWGNGIDGTNPGSDNGNFQQFITKIVTTIPGPANNPKFAGR